jgi:uncharacterized membrane protein
VKFLKILLIILGVLLTLIGLLLWSFALSRKDQANWENWNGKLHFQTVLMCSAPIVVGIISIAIGFKIRRKISN